MLQTQKKGFSVELKGEINLVTSADQQAEARIASRLRKSFPEFGLLAEETGATAGRMASDAVWVVDPLDGTTNFAHRLPVFAVSIALWEKGKPVLGVVYHPALRELFWAVKGKGAFLNKKRIFVSRTADPNSALLSTGFPYDLRESRENNLDYFAAFATRVRAIRRMGAAALDIAWTAAGRFDGFWELKLFPWDLAAAVLMVTEAGGKLSDFEGGSLALATRNVVASNGRLHNFILTVIEECRRKTLFAAGEKTTVKKGGSLLKRTFLTLSLLVFSAGGALAILPGPIKDFYAPRAGDTTAVVFGTRGVSANWVKKIELLAYRNADFLKQKDPSRVVQVYADTAFPKELFSSRSLVLMGTPGSNSFLAEGRNYYPFIFRAGRLNIPGRKLYLGEGLTLTCIFPNPLASDRYVLLLVGDEPTTFPSLSDWPGDYDYYIAQRHTFLGQYLSRGKFEKKSDQWSQELSEYDRIPGDTATLVGLIYPYGKIWYPFQWEEDSLWSDPLPERIRLLASLQELISPFEQFLGMRPYANIDFHLSDRYPEPFAYDPVGRVFIRTHPKQMDSLAFLSWGKPLVRVLFPCRDAPLDWELFGQRYFLAERFLQHAQKTPFEFYSADQGNIWAEVLSNQDSTYLQLLIQLVKRKLAGKIGEALDSVMAQGNNYSFSMREFTNVLGRIVSDGATRKMLRLPFHPSPYERPLVYHLGIRNLRELFLNQEIVLGGLEPKSRAATAGLRKGDKIISIDGFPTDRNRSRSYLAWLGKKKGQNLKLVIDRNGVRRTLVIPVG